ncbi:Potential acrAB operon repressor [Delftia tsuruhatensis]|uniref:TetR/AcrR family transcriptional regulator n=1 Tax=Delftia tsuruhatensis TaxID=180282 RepID=UPI001E812F92|nr:TetR/AcrR family transcriptional regulator [Delftia tsuruhatensis]CAB5662938.1 Potential acrAB operon repressor [Delftia tsuruhatensis]CAC9677264.1 Potential acrAB operon repressor [Delftia tsuruhatensis]
MKVSKAQAAQNRQDILEAASRLYREHGLDGVGVAEVTRGAGLTHGGLYRHFESKDALVREACARAFDWSIAPLDGLQDTEQGSLAARVQSYLSPQHRDSPGSGCPAAALAVDVARAGADLSAVFAEGVERNIVRFARVIGGLDDSQAPDGALRAQSMAMLSSMVGALVLARATAAANPALSDEILATVSARLLAREQPDG